MELRLHHFLPVKILSFLHQDVQSLRPAIVLRMQLLYVFIQSVFAIAGIIISYPQEQDVIQGGATFTIQCSENGIPQTNTGLVEPVVQLFTGSSDAPVRPSPIQAFGKSLPSKYRHFYIRGQA